MKREIFSKAIFIVLFFICSLISQNSYSQGWGFTFQVIVTGNCAAYLTRSFPTNGFPTQMQCERARQMVQAIKSSTFGCTARLECTPCSGSDIASKAIDFNAGINGKPVFVAHESDAFKEWSSEYKQVLASYNVNSILGKGIIRNTDFSSYENLYLSLASNYKLPPPASPKIPTSPQTINANEVDLTNKTGVVQLLTTPEEQKKRDEYYQGQLQNQGYDNLTQMDVNNPAIVDPVVNTQQDNNVKTHVAEVFTDAIGDFLGMAATTLVPRLEVPNFIQGLGQNLAQATTTNIQNGLNAISGSGSPGAVKDPGKLFVNSYIGTCTLCKWILTPVLK